MMTETLQERWRRMHAAGMVRWMPGMVDAYGDRVLEDYGDGRVVTSRIDGHDHMIEEPSSTLCPDFNDPATLGCLLAQAREAWSLETLFAAFVIGSGRWTVFSHMANPLVAVCGDGASEPEALLDAIERAHGASA